MDNPWKSRYQNEKYKYIASCDDTEKLEIFNKLHPKEEEKIHFELPSSNVIGDPDNCKVMILLMNPGFSNDDLKDLKNNDFINAFYDRNDFFLLDEKISDTNAFSWWNLRLFKPVSKEFNEIDPIKVRNELIKNVCNVEYFPYHSMKFSNDLFALRLPSQKYAFESVEKAVKRNIPIIIAKGKIEYWAYHVKDFFDYSNIYKLSSQRNSTISNNNLISKINSLDKEWKKGNHLEKIFKFVKE